MKKNNRTDFPSRPPYQLFAQCYDQIMEHIDYEAWANSITSMLHKHNCPGKKLLDAACGTGTMIQMMHKNGYTIDGMDISKAMLQQTEKKIKKLTIPAKLFQGDIRNFKTKQQYDAILCLHDSVNYLCTIEEIGQALDSFYQALKPNGILIFDASTYYNIIKNFSGHTFCDNKLDFSYLWRNKFNLFTGRMTATLEILLKENNSIGEESHKQRIYRRKKMVRQIGKRSLFTLEAQYDGYSTKKPGIFSEEITFVCKKN